MAPAEDLQDPGIQHELGFAHDLQAALPKRQPHGEDRHLFRLWHADYPSTMTAAEKSIRLARASDRIKVIIAQLQVVKNEVDIALLEMRALQAQLEAPATSTTEP